MFILIIGCGKFGRNLAKSLSDNGNDVCVVERDSEKLNSLGSGFNGRKIKGIEFDSDILIEAGVDQADALVAVTSDDNINITVSLIAEKIYKVPRIISRVNDPDKSYLYKILGLDTINPIQYEIEMLENRLPLKNLEVISELGSGFEIIEAVVRKEKYFKVINIEKKFDCAISGIVRNGVFKIPEITEEIFNGDKIICTIYKSQIGKLINYISKESLI